jgi:plastocyanin domain-containing protein
VVPDRGIKRDLPLGKPVEITFTPQKAGELRYVCGMGMFSGRVIVK